MEVVLSVAVLAVSGLWIRELHQSRHWHQKALELERLLALKERPREQKLITAVKALLEQHDGSKDTAVKQYLFWHPGANPYTVRAAVEEASRKRA